MKEGSPSSTARTIAWGILFLARDPRFAALVPARAAELSRGFVEDGSMKSRLLLRLIEHGWFRGLVWSLERSVAPGILAHYALRKRRLEEETRAALAEGYGQVVVIGAGLDTLAARLSEEYPEPVFIEVDHPDTQAVKRRALATPGPERGNLCLLPADLAERDLREVLTSELRYRPEAPTVFIAEGLLMYLSEEDVDTLFRAVAASGGPGSRFLFTYMEPQADGRVNFDSASGALLFWLRLRGEPFRWGIRTGDLRRFLEARGWRLRETVSPEELRRRYLPEADGRANGDRIAVAEGGRAPARNESNNVEGPVDGRGHGLPGDAGGGA